MNNLALAYGAVGNFKRAAEVQQEVLEQRRTVLPPEHRFLLASSNNLAMAWRDMGRFPEALDQLEETAERARQVLGTNDYYTITFFNNVALVAEDTGQTNKALRLFEETFNQRRDSESLGPDHPATLRAMNYWGRALMRSGHLDQAESVLGEAERRWRATDSNDVRTGASTLANLAECLLLKGDAAGAEARACEYVALAEESSPRPWCKAEATGLLGAALLGQGHLKEAETNLLAAFEELQASYARVPAHTGPRLCGSLAAWILQLQEALGPGDSAEQWRERLQTLEQMKQPGA